MYLKMKKNIQLLDTLYGNEEIQFSYQNIIDENLIDISDTNKWCPNQTVKEEDIIPSHEASLYSLRHEDVDVRPRYFDKYSNTWFLTR